MQAIQEGDLAQRAWELYNESHDQFVLLQDKYMPEEEPAAVRKLLMSLDQEIYKCLGLVYSEDKEVLQNKLIDVAIRAFAGVLMLRSEDEVTA